MNELVLDDAEATALSWLFEDGCREARQTFNSKIYSRAEALAPFVHAYIAGTQLHLDRDQLRALAEIVDLGRDRNADVLRDVERAGSLPAATRSLASKIVHAGRLA